MDQSSLPLGDTERALQDLQRVNRWTFGTGPAVRTLKPLIGRGPAQQRLLDLGTGTGDVAVAVEHSARRQGVTLQVIGVDRKLSHLLFGRRLGIDQVRVVAEGGSLPFREGSVDWSLSNLLFHHFGAKGNRRVLSEMQRVAGRGAVVVDLRRSVLALLLIGPLLWLLRVGYVARNDGRVSAQEAWRLAEIRRLVADLPTLELRRRFPFRFSLVLAPMNPP